jgi:hypothetical protein
MVNIPLAAALTMVLDLSLLACCCMVCHGELAALRPARQRLTSYYLAITAGGVLGSAFLTFLSPLLVRRSLEVPFVLMIMSAVLLFSALSRPVNPVLPHRRNHE